MLSIQELTSLCDRFTESSPYNYISKEQALDESCVGLRIYDAPLIAVADAADPLFEAMKKPEAVGPQFKSPQDWLCGAKSVFSFFLPFSEDVRSSNRISPDVPSNQWLHARIEGQRFVVQLAQYLCSQIEAQGGKALVPVTEPEFCAVELPDESREGLWKDASFTSNWSERHVAYIAGLGTFGMSKGLITAKGIAGRFGSLVTDVSLPATEREYTGIYDYCSRCGACARRCPVNAINMESGKDHLPCAAFVAESMRLYAPRYGCGKCQVAVPCENKIPGR